jgi:hypothetical protein
MEYERDTSARILFGTIVRLQKVGDSKLLLLKVTRNDWKRAMKEKEQGEEKEKALLGDPEGKPCSSCSSQLVVLNMWHINFHLTRMIFSREAASASTFQPRGVLLAIEWLMQVTLRVGSAQVSKDFEGIGA